jgi:antirestriction protein ArdC
MAAAGPFSSRDGQHPASPARSLHRHHDEFASRILLRITDEPRADHAHYLASWLAVLKADRKAIFTAASKASQAATFLTALQRA